jgi:hypothetical protein
MRDDDFNGHGPRGSEPSLPPLTHEELQGLVEETIHHLTDDERQIQRIDDRTRSLIAGTSPWQREVNVQLERIEGCVIRLTNQMKLTTFQVQTIQYAKVAGPVLLSVFAGGFLAVFIFLIATHK